MRLTSMFRFIIPQITAVVRGFFLAPEVTDGKPPSGAAPGAPRRERSVLQRNLDLTVLHGLFNSAAINMVAPFTAIFAMKLGASKLHVAFLTSAPAIISLAVMIPSALLLDRTDRKKRLTYLFMLAHRAFYLGLACVPFFVEASRATVFVLLLALMNLPGAASNVAWQTFISKIVPSERRAAVFAARNRLISVFGTFITLVVGLFLDRALFPLGYQIIFAAAFLVALVEMYVFNLTEEPSTETPPATSLQRRVRPWGARIPRSTYRSESPLFHISIITAGRSGNLRPKFCRNAGS